MIILIFKLIKLCSLVYLYDPFVGMKQPHKLVIEIKNEIAKNFVIQQANGPQSGRQCLRYALEFASIVLSDEDWLNHNDIEWVDTDSRK